MTCHGKQTELLGHGEQTTSLTQDTKPTQQQHQVPSMTKKQILKNVFMVSVGFTLLFTAYNAMANLQTSLNKEEGVGALSFVALFISLMVASLFLPKFVIARLGCKWTITVAMTATIVFIAANFHAVLVTMIPGATLLGLGAALLWAAKGTYLTQLGVWYSRLTGTRKDEAISFFFGVFFCFHQTSQIWGNLISSLVFTSGDSHHVNGEDQLCGSVFCPHDAVEGNITDNFSQTSTKVYIVCGIFLASSCTATILVASFLDSIVLDTESSKEDRKLSPRLLVETFRHMMSSPLQMMLIPLTIWQGMEQSFLQGEFTMAYISCSLGIWNVGYVMICYGAVDAVCSFLFGRLVRYIGHVPLFILLFAVQGGLLVFFLAWRPHRDQTYLFYLCAALWGVGDAVTQTQLTSLYGNLFHDRAEAAFASLRLWESMGFVLSYGYNSFLCTHVKIYICLGLLALSAVCYTGIEIKVRSRSKNAAETSYCIT